MRHILWAIVVTMVSAAGIALAAQSADNTYAVQLWISRSGGGMARTTGPISIARCRRELPQLRAEAPPDARPRLQTRLVSCESSQKLEQLLDDYACVLRSSVGAENADYRFSNYGCGGECYVLARFIAPDPQTGTVTAAVWMIGPFAAQKCATMANTLNVPTPIEGGRSAGNLHGAAETLHAFLDQEGCVLQQIANMNSGPDHIRGIYLCATP